ncbi:hypothetical protein GC197_09005 [bacterium]|nr:hypothetical protein [bacterium]
MFEISVPNDLNSLDDLFVQLEQFASSVTLGEKTRYHLLLICEELFVNFTSHASAAEGRFDVHLDHQPEGLLLTVLTDGVAFNPLEAKRPDIDADIDDRPIGGLGLHFVRRLTDYATYHRDDSRNVLKLRIP